MTRTSTNTFEFHDVSSQGHQQLTPTVSRLGERFDLESSTSPPRPHDALPPVDRGKAVWIYLTVAFLIEALGWGFAFSFGVFQEYYSSHPRFAGDKSISVIGTVCTGIPYLSSPFLFQACARWPNSRKQMLWTGLGLCVLGSVGASFATKTAHLIVTQGMLYGTGTALLYVVIYSWINEWFVARRGLAVGIIYSGTGISGLILPFVLSALLQRYNYATVFRLWAIFLTITIAPAIYFVRGRLPPSHIRVQPRVPLNFLTSPHFLIFCLSNILQGLGYFLPLIYLPSYASSLQLSATSSTLVLSMLNLATVFGQIVLGWSSDKVDVHHILFLSSVFGGLSCFVLWGFSKTLPPLIGFSLVYGFTAGGYSVLWSRFAAKVAGDDTGMWMIIFGIFAAEKGLGSVLSGPISTKLLEGSVVEGEYAVGRYRGMVCFVGATMVASAIGVGGRLIKGR